MGTERTPTRYRPKPHKHVGPLPYLTLNTETVPKSCNNLWTVVDNMHRAFISNASLYVHVQKNKLKIKLNLFNKAHNALPDDAFEM